MHSSVEAKNMALVALFLRLHRLKRTKKPPKVPFVAPYFEVFRSIWVEIFAFALVFTQGKEMVPECILNSDFFLLNAH